MKNSARISRPLDHLHSGDELAGTGTSLSTVHTIIRRHIGKITIKSAPDVEKTFTITLPRPAGVEPTEEYGE